MTLWQAVLLGVVQGVTEFLPVSSSGHLVILEHFLGVQQPQLTLVVFLHFGTLLSILVVFRAEVIALFSVNRRVLVLILMGNIPAALVGFGFHRRIESAFSSLLAVGAALLVTGLLLTLAERTRQLLRRMAREAERTDLAGIGVSDALVIGIAQAVAILPGISRSGATISAALMCGLKRDAAASFSFLLALPAIAGATALQLREMALAGQAAPDPLMLAVGVAVAFLTGVASLKLLLAVLQRRRLLLFAGYCFTLGAMLIGWTLWRG
jgi:undecaprenyl-diphosphatase